MTVDTHIEPFYQDAACTIYHGDCREILPTLEKVDLLLTDPPYGIGYGGKKNRVGGSAGRDKAGWKTWVTDWDETPVAAELLDLARNMTKTEII